jgi:2'-5' RNA ligase
MNSRLSGERLFAALEIPEEIKAGLANLKSCIPGLKWTPAANVHLTLRFIGPVSQARSETIRQALRGIQGDSFKIYVVAQPFNETASLISNFPAKT